MQETTLLFLALVMGHLLGDFILQTKNEVDSKATLAWRPYARHAVIHYGATLLCLTLLAGLSPVAGRVQIALLMIVATHLAVDVGKSLFSHAFPDRYVLSAFLLDQVAHVVVLVLVAWSFLSGRPLEALSVGVGHPVEARAVAIMVTYTAVVMAGGHLVRIALLPFARVLDDAGRTGDQLAYAGLYIGRLERFLVLTAVLAGSYTSVGLIVAAKSIFRFPDMKDRPFAEYFLVGTLMSVTVAIVGALLLSLLAG